MSKALDDRKALEHQMLKRMAEKWKQDREARPHGPYTANPEPPGDGWDTVIHNAADFASAGPCELWRMDFGDEIRHGCFNDFPPWFNFTGMWWRKAS